MALARVLLVEDDLLLRNTLGELLEHRSFDVVGLVNSAEEALIVNREKKPEVLLIDLDLGPGPNGIDIAHALRKENSNLGIVFLTSFSDPRFLDPNNLRIPTGSMYFTKSQVQDVSILITAILRAKSFPLTSIRRMEPEKNPLTNLQIGILRRVSEGAPSTLIAKDLGLSVKSIEAHLAKIHKILGLERRVDVSPRIQLTRAFFAITGKRPQGWE
jgi:DNA-binding NarL/FixJ family response regulator